MPMRSGLPLCSRRPLLRPAPLLCLHSPINDLHDHVSVALHFVVDGFSR
jgi:hypothetical protein